MTHSINITVRLGEPLRRAVKAYRIQLRMPAQTTLADLLAQLRQTYPDFASRFAGQDIGHAYPYRVFVNHRLLDDSSFTQHVLEDGDLVHIVLPVGGGEKGAAPLPQHFFARSALEVAPDLLGCHLVRELEGVEIVGKIVEVEAYLGEEDAASHAFHGPTPRSQVMFGPAGIAYVYFIYGAHHCLNVVTGDRGQGQAVLIRALEPLRGIEEMQKRRGQKDVRQLTSGPGKLCQALAIDRSFSGHDLTQKTALWLASGTPPEAIYCSPRVGVRGDNPALQAPWRFFIRDNPYVSRTKLNAQAALWRTQPLPRSP